MTVKGLDTGKKLPVATAGDEDLVVGANGLGQHGHGTIIKLVLFELLKLLLVQLGFWLIQETKNDNFGNEKEDSVWYLAI